MFYVYEDVYELEESWLLLLDEQGREGRGGAGEGQGRASRGPESFQLCLIAPLTEQLLLSECLGDSSVRVAQTRF